MMILAGVSASIFAFNRIFLIPLFPEFGFFRKYFGDVLALPVYLPLSYYLAWRLGLITDDFQIKSAHVLGAGIIFSFLFEGLVPLIDTTSTRDPIDVLAYFAGGLVLYIVANTGRQNSINQL
ncbi:MAG: hypothetical protein HN995_10690 [Candidatus Marinimicrobia bacterium]|jgi:hypothetical protein|nr:hypothetical protein [Candidatus Neomarinimicrobiota bacterium]MBT3680047.1 hypothetical protein [Candidatus Neomarinimicrobiota bacterium]MBT3950032.1 hypothetical protein [Candidatus Neomarinimicrobiota bacterium]MBT4295812.1 hypothetical protein [Candidatus Neomarinimicrobiota bacterium]MBT4480321.1 hypothetical protein [Candidatus Neomarinimicrobiota bacterium]